MLAILNKAFIILLFITLSNVTFANDKCINGKVKIQLFSVEKVENVRYCFKQNRTTLYTENCHNARCLKEDIFLDISFDDLFSEFGTPGFSLCSKIGGKAQIIKFYVNGKWYPLDRCVINSNTFIDTGLLLDYFRKATNP